MYALTGKYMQTVSIQFFHAGDKSVEAMVPFSSHCERNSASECREIKCIGPQAWHLCNSTVACSRAMNLKLSVSSLLVQVI